MGATEQEVFVEADRALTGVIDQITPDQWDLTLPDWFNTGGSDESYTVRTIVNYHASDESWVPETLAGRTIEEVGDRYDGDLLGEDPKASWHGIVDRATDAVTSFIDLDRVVHLTYGDFPAREYLWHITSFRVMRAIDLARALGVDDQLPESLVAAHFAQVAPHAEEWRSMGVFGPAIEVADDAPIQQRLLGLTGRPPVM